MRSKKPVEFPAVEVDGVLIWSVQMDLDADLCEMVQAFLMDRVMDGVTHVVLDLQALPMMDSVIASSLREVLQACTLAGASAYVCGVRSGVALCLTHLDVRFDGTPFARDVDHTLSMIRQG